MSIRRLSIALIAIALAACATSPTGRQQLKLFPDEQMVRMGATAFEELKKESPPSRNASQIRYVRCVADALTREVSSTNAWEVQVFDGEEANAFALPGGKIGVYTGMLSVARNQHQLAAVVAHEISHVTADHGNARVSASYATQAGLQLASVIAGATTPMRQQLMGLLGLGAQYGVLMPYGRGQESEADRLGLELMARAGFDPREAVSLWRNMQQAHGSGPPAFLSTHPSPGGRIETLSNEMPQALALHRAARAAGKSPNCQ